MSKKKPCGLDYCPQEEIVGAYASCTACAWSNNNSDAEYENSVDQLSHDTLYLLAKKSGKSSAMY